MDRKKTKHKGIYKVGKVYYMTYYAQGKKHEKAVGAKLQRALDEKKEMEEKAQKGKYDIIERMEKTTFKQLMDLYKEKGDGKFYILKFEKQYLDFFKERKLSSISRSDLFGFRDEVKNTPKQRGGKEVKDSSVNRSLAGLRRLFNFGMAQEYLEESPFPKDPKSGLFYSESKGLRNFFSEEQMVKIINAAPDWLKPMIETAHLTGMRAGEMLRLRWDHIDLEAGIIYLPASKTLKDNTGLGQRIMMQEELNDLFRGLPSRSECVFTRWDGMPYNHWEIHKPFKKILKSLGIDTKKYSWKELRHTTGSLMNLKGVSPLAIKDQLRHSSIKTTERFYLGTDMENQRAQAEKLVLNDLPLS